MAKKKQTVGLFEVRYGKDPGDPDSEKGWRLYRDGAVYGGTNVHEDEDDAIQQAEEASVEIIKDEIYNALPDDLESLLPIYKFVVTGEDA